MALMLPTRSILSASLLLLAACTVGYAGDAAPPADELSPAAKRALNTAEEAIAKARATFSAAATKEQDKLLTALQREQEAQTKAGKLEAALAVKAAADKVRSGDFLKELDARAAESDDLLGDKAVAQTPSLARLAGHWAMHFDSEWRRLIRIEPDGRVSVLRSNNLAQGSSYSLRWDAKAAGFLSEGLGNMLELYRIEGDRLTCQHWCDGTKYPAEEPSMTAAVERAQPPGQGPSPGQGPRREAR